MLITSKEEIKLENYTLPYAKLLLVIGVTSTIV